MEKRTRIYIAGGFIGLILVVSLTAKLWSDRQIAKQEDAIAEAKSAADKNANHASQREIEAAEYRRKIEYLEHGIAEIQTIARKQDEELQTLNANTNRARGDVDRARRVRSVETTAAELCGKLAELGYGC